MGLAAANSLRPSSPQDPRMVNPLLCPQGVTCPRSTAFHQDPQSCGVSRSCWSPTLQEWPRENRKASGAVPEGSYCWPGSRGSVRGRRHRGHPVTPLCPEPLVAAHSPLDVPQCGQAAARGCPGLPLPPHCSALEGKINKPSFFRVLLPWLRTAQLPAPGSRRIWNPGSVSNEKKPAKNLEFPAGQKLRGLTLLVLGWDRRGGRDEEQEGHRGHPPTAHPTHTQGTHRLRAELVPVLVDPRSSPSP